MQPGLRRSSFGLIVRQMGRAEMTDKPPGFNSFDPELGRLIRESQARYDALTPEQKAAHDQAQKESWVRAMMPTGDPRWV